MISEELKRGIFKENPIFGSGASGSVRPWRSARRSSMPWAWAAAVMFVLIGSNRHHFPGAQMGPRQGKNTLLYNHHRDIRHYRGFMDEGVRSYS
jgi:hypothetical protein